MPDLSNWKVWNEFLFGLWKEHRHSIGWQTLISLHDDEDRQYFEMLDSYVGGKNGKE